jgi:hypothetical protein
VTALSGLDPSAPLCSAGATSLPCAGAGASAFLRAPLIFGGASASSATTGAKSGGISAELCSAVCAAAAKTATSPPPAGLAAKLRRFPFCEDVAIGRPQTNRTTSAAARAWLAEIIFFTAPLRELAPPGGDPNAGERGSVAGSQLNRFFEIKTTRFTCLSDQPMVNRSSFPGYNRCAIGKAAAHRPAMTQKPSAPTAP